MFKETCNFGCVSLFEMTRDHKIVLWITKGSTLDLCLNLTEEGKSIVALKKLLMDSAKINEKRKVNGCWLKFFGLINSILPCL